MSTRRIALALSAVLVFFSNFPAFANQPYDPKDLLDERNPNLTRVQIVRELRDECEAGLTEAANRLMTAGKEVIRMYPCQPLDRLEGPQRQPGNIGLVIYTP